MFYFGSGGRDFVKRTMKDLTDHIQVECDGVNISQKLKDLKIHCLLFLNIPKYCAGATPWGNPSQTSTSFGLQSHDDGKLEVIGLTYAQLATLHIGG